MLLYNKIDGMKMKIIIQNKEMEDLNDEIAIAKETRNKEIPGTILSTILFTVFITNAFPIGFLIATGLISVVGLTGITLNNKKIKNYSIYAGKIAEDLRIKLEKNGELKKELSELMTEIKIEKLRSEKKEELVKAAVGLTLQEAENAFARAMVNDGCLNSEDVDIVLKEKSQVIKKSDILEYIDSKVKIEDVGGLENLKKWLSKRDKSWLDSAKKYGLPSPKGVLLTGVPGCGKSLIAKSISSMWHLPLLRFDVSKVFNMYVGNSESNMREAIKMAEAISPCVLWIDEIEKGFSGLGGSGDSGTTSRIFGTFLSWMQEKTKPVFVVATANNIDSLPSEMMRKGRFDEIFFIDLPTFNERKQIFKVHF